jgi:hypothetical protein
VIVSLFATNQAMGLARIELATSRLSGVRSNQLSYRPVSSFEKAGKEGAEPPQRLCRPLRF